MSAGYYNIALVCKNGHTLSAAIDEFPVHQSNYCGKCGAETMSSCLHCNTPIRGDYNIPDIVCLGDTYTPPSYCYKCGKPFPWLEHALEAAKQLIDEADELSEQEKAVMNESIKRITTDSPMTIVAVSRFKKLLGKVSKGIGEGLYKIAVDVASEAAKKMLTGGM